MKKALILIYIVTLLYITSMLIFGNLRFLIFDDFIRNILDPHTFLVFNLLGIFPFMIILYMYFYDIKLNNKNSKLIYLSFLFGGFVLYPVIFSSNIKKAKRLNNLPYINLIFITISAYTLFIFFYMEVFGDFSNYLYMFKNDILVHIMTIDLMITYILSLILIAKQEKNWYISLIPVFGLLFLLNSKNFAIHNR